MTSVLLTPYPPGIPLLIPGERFNRQIVEYLQFARTSTSGSRFDTDIHGLVEEESMGAFADSVDCVAGAKVIAAMPTLRVRSVKERAPARHAFRRERHHFGTSVMSIG